MKTPNLLSKIFIYLFCIFFSCCFATIPTYDEISLQQTLNALEMTFVQLEQAVAPPAGYQINIIYEKSTGKYQGLLQGVGSRDSGSPIVMLSVKTCLFCMRRDCIFLNERPADKKFKVFFSKNKPITMGPSSHILQWFDSKKLLDDESFFNLKCALIKKATLLCRLVEEHFPEKFSTNDTYCFAINCGFAAGQTTPHLCLSIISDHGRLTTEEWGELKRNLEGTIETQETLETLGEITYSPRL